MARKHPRPPATAQQSLAPQRCAGFQCGGTLWIAYRSVRTITTLDGLCHLHLTIRRCHNPICPRYRQPYRPEEEGHWALPHGEFGLDVIALIGTLLAEMEQTPTSSEPLATMLSTFRKVTTSYWPGLFHCYDILDLPRTATDPL